MSPLGLQVIVAAERAAAALVVVLVLVGLARSPRLPLSFRRRWQLQHRRHQYASRQRPWHSKFRANLSEPNQAGGKHSNVSDWLLPFRCWLLDNDHVYIVQPDVFARDLVVAYTAVNLPPVFLFFGS